jgi:hypothetical protein
MKGKVGQQLEDRRVVAVLVLKYLNHRQQRGESKSTWDETR